MIPSDQVSPSGKGKGVGVVLPTLAVARDTILAIDVKTDLRRGFEGN